MKKNIFCCFLLLALLAGCGQKEPENAIFEMEDDKGTEAAAKEEEEEDAASGKTEDGLVAVADIHGMKLPYLATAKDMDCFHLDQGWLYMGKIAWNPDEERIEMRISRNDIRAGYEPQEYVVLPEAYNLLAFATDGEGNCYVYGQYAANEEAGLFSLEKYDEGGAIVWRRDYTDGELGGMGMQLSEATAVSDGRVFLYTCGTGGSVACFGQEGNLEGITVPEIENLEGLAATGDGQVFAYGTPFGQIFSTFLEIGGEESQFTSPQSFQKVFKGRGGCLCLCTRQGLWEYDTKTGENRLLWNWDDEYVQLAGDEVDMLFWEADICHILSWYHGAEQHGLYWESGTDLTFADVSLRDRGEYPEKKVITLTKAFMPDVGSWMDDLVRMYNRQSREYTLELISYDGKSDFDKFGQLEKQLLKGEGPDLMELGNVDALNLAGKGVLEDLTEYYERSNKVDWQDLLPKIQESSVLNGRNALVIPFFYIRTWVSKDAVPAEDWTLRRFLEMAQECQMFPSSNPYALLVNSMTIPYMERFIDYGKKECYFNSPEFKEILEAFAAVPSREVHKGTYSADYLEDEYLLYLWNFRSMSDYLAVRDFWGDNVDYQGVPGWEGAEHALLASDVFAMNSASTNKEGAWDFLEFLLSREVQDSAGWGFPARADSMDVYLDRSYINSEDAKAAGRVYSGAQPEEEDFAAVRDMISASSYTTIFEAGDVVDRIIKEEAAMYFSGDATLEQTAEKIQNRVMLYLNE